MELVTFRNNEKVLIFENSNWDTIPINYFGSYNHVEELEFRLNNLSKLTYIDMKYFENVTKIVLEINNVIVLKKDTFLASVRLEILEISAKKLKFLSKKIFKELTVLRKLTLNIPPKVFESIPLFQYNNKIANLTLISETDTVTYTFFQILPNIQYLYLNGCFDDPLNSFQTSLLTYKNFVYLKSLTIEGNLYLQINENSFLTTSNHLKILKIRYCNINSLHFITNLHHLDYCELIENNVIDPSDKCVVSPAMKYLKFNFNKNCAIILSTASRLQSFDFSYNSKSSFYQLLPEINQLQFLNLSYHKVASIIRSNFKYYYPLKSLMLNNGYLNEIAKRSFSHLHNLEILLLNHNHLKSFPDFLFKKCFRLKTLNLSYNHLTQFRIIWFGFNEFHTLQYLNLSFNKISDLENFAIFPNLKYLNLMHNKLKIIANSNFIVLEKLVVLNLSFNGNLYGLDENSFEFFENLEILQLSYCKIKKIPANLFNKLRLLKYLDLSFNQLQMFDENLFSFNRNLNRLYLNNNSITVIGDNLFRYCFRLQYLDVSFNRFKEISNIWVSDIQNLNCFMCDSKFRAKFKDTLSIYFTKWQLREKDHI